jgi:hypothetical protein
MARQILPLSGRKLDIAIQAFVCVNLLLITYVVELEQLVMANPSHFTYPLWPPEPAVDLSHWWGYNFDHDLLARPAWWRVTIWFDNLGFGPFYLVTIYAYIKGKDWIQIPSVIYASAFFTIVLIILGEAWRGQYASPHLPIVLLANLAWLTFPVIIIARMWRAAHPFTRAVETVAAPAASTL